jgi:tetratricopeptide (TPR) repeat protein
LISKEKTPVLDLLLKFYDLTESMTHLSNGAERCIIAPNNSRILKALALLYISSSERFKKDYKNLMDDIRNYIPDIPAKEWEGISAAGARLSDQIEKLVKCFKDITVGIKDLDSTIKNLRKEYKSLWGLVLTNAFSSFAKIMTTNIIARFYDLTESMMSLSSSAAQQRISESNKDTTLKALALLYISSSERFKKDYKNLMDDIRNYIPDDKWEGISATGARLSDQIEKLIDDFTKITDRKTEIQSTMSNLRSEYKTLWQEIFRNLISESSPDIVSMMTELKEISFSSLSASADPKLNHILVLLQKISDMGDKKAITFSKFEQYDKAAGQYRLIATAYSEVYSKMINLIKNPLNEQPVLEFLSKTVRYWQKQEEEAMEMYYTSQITKYKNEGEELLARGLYSEALAAFDEALKFKPSIHTADIWIRKGNVFSHRREFNDAIICYEKALSLNENSGDAWYNKGKCFIELGKYEDARMCFDRAIEIYPNDYGAWWGKGNSLYFMGRYDEASVCFDNAIKINPQEHILWFNKGMIFFQRGEVEEAVKHFEKALKINPESLPVRATLAEIVLMKKDYKKYEKLSKEMSDLPESRNYEFGMLLLEVLYLYLNDRAKEAMKATMDLLDYYESIAEDPSSDLSLSNWDFRNLRSMIEKSDFVADKKSLLLSLVSLPSGDASLDLDNLRSTTQRIYYDHEKVDKPTELVSPMRIKDMVKDMDIRIVNTSKSIKDRKGWYNWEIHVEPENVWPQIDYVQYTLHPTFKDPIRKIEKREGGFKIQSSGWGQFNVKVQIALKNGRTITKYHWLHLKGSDPLGIARFRTI